ncbi:glutamate-rich protein grpB [Thecamonas trahens ATCC 50062]|uniref:Glutamate-rich protein grpB n=1 Tax=Thecamonas trahens ATCC 50062 TaxID=461836 RepID=A0A0L0DUR6_THETB|nr:glutamate-rich protein grpB [Thecamonas trahens ATCC 50062]KNC55975.1 glutamate-rich protein grpB [Thecamonas trahens ATCC 50062]|eukprot:XP_013761022.1 glutamate-rich protein grpB [Thecamonas trahens ATCC 50062]
MADGMRLEHIGSTAVPGIPAKPVIDVLCVVPFASLAEVDEIVVPHFPHAGWFTSPEYNAMLGERRYFRAWDAAGAAHRAHLHVVPHVSEQGNQFLLAAEYAELKIALAEAHSHDRSTYTARKAVFVGNVVQSVAGAM